LRFGLLDFYCSGRLVTGATLKLSEVSLGLLHE
jgi:hypothetical protein